MNTDNNTSPDDNLSRVAAMSQWQLIWLRFCRHKLALVSLFVVIALYVTALLAPFIAPYPENFKNMACSYNPPMPVRFTFGHGFHAAKIQRQVDRISYRKDYVVLPGEVVELELFGTGHAYRFLGLFETSRHLLVPRNRPENIGTEREQMLYVFGADKYGQDLFSRILAGAQISLSVGLLAILISFTLGISIGCLSGYFGGWVDLLIQRLIELLQSIPSLPLWMALGAAVPADWSVLKTYFSILIILSLLGWTGLARVVRGKILSLREEDYAIAARLLGASNSRIMFRHLVPGFMSHLIVSITMALPGMILAETSLSFLNIGLRPPVVSWGVMLQDCMNMQAVELYPWLLLPVIFIVITVLSFNFLGDGLRDAADPYSSR